MPHITGRICLGLAFALLACSTAASAGQILALPGTVAPLITTPDDPDLYVVTPPSAYNGVAKLGISRTDGSFGCSGSLLSGGQFVLTAAHCISSTGPNPNVNSLTATFNAGAGEQTYAGEAYYVPPGWTGDFNDGADIALIRLSTPVLGITGYNIWRGADPFGTEFDLAGYGRRGYGATGSVPNTFGTLRAGRNVLDTVFDDVAGNPYAWDFDNGNPLNDSICIVFGVCNTGLGVVEVMIASGDSGGPSFFGGFLGGVHSFGGTYGITGGDVDADLNSSFGEVAGDTRVNFYTDWIDSVMTPEPDSVLLLGVGLTLLCWAARRRFTTRT